MTVNRGCIKAVFLFFYHYILKCQILFLHKFTGIFLLHLLILFFFFNLVFADSSVKKGNQFYKKGKYDEALINYNEAQVDFPDSDIIDFNIGAALYKKGDYKKAEEAFAKALTTENPQMEADATYNIGNCKYKQGRLKENTDLSAAIERYREALEYYKRAVELDQENKDARYNHELVEKRLKMLLDKLKKQPPSEKEEKDEKKQKEQQKQAGSQGEQKEKDQSQTKENQKEYSEKEDKDESVSKAQEVPEKEEKKKELSEEEARMILESHALEELSSGDLKDGKSTGYHPEVLKDW